ncbi:Helicase conserved C-terminal domain-containing protein [Evansella caseinilytica]|uniref:Helicase conserved C-terminal domain-containing protein n=1 Tax=Evansella caseinilytica TaxID=1503961 RepID=A0A1H3KUJ8_9BACI|nr:SNF2-related protein [Evansella caseinilytica]SDY55438.1 Helicase conserved C-terminal domain-containing protein [Evansella caseinilytica]
MIPDIRFDEEWVGKFLESLHHPQDWGNWQQFKMALAAGKSRLVESFYGLEAPKHLPSLEVFPHQFETAQTVIEKMNGKAILADEVGLGKTIEAGLILKEYMIRGLVKKVLIMVPASLVTQWCRELNEKFYIPAIEQRKKPAWEQIDVAVTSIDTAKREPHAAVIQSIDYDFIIVDEAHKLKNKKTKNYQFVKSLKKKFCLLLTATPVQNRLSEVFHLISLLKPGHLGDESSFEQKYKQEDAQHELNQLIQKVMVRNRRSDSGMNWPKRKVETVPIFFTEDEKALYAAVSSLKTKWRGIAEGLAFTTLTLQREACSSKEAVYMTLKNLIEQYEYHTGIRDDLAEIMALINNVNINSKAEQVLSLIQGSDDKMIIFTEYRATQLFLQWFLGQHGIKAVPFRGGFKRSKKDWMKQLFKDHAQVLIATEAGGEGINLQFCHKMINYDLPWNPMRIEQRIGRIHRLGQTEDVEIYNFAVQGTVEEHILGLLYKKIGLFEDVIGKLDDILEQLPGDQVEEHVANILLHSDSEGEIRVKLDNLSAVIAE